MKNELSYLNLVGKVLTDGIKRPDRTGVGTLSIFGAKMEFDLRNNMFPLLTTKRVNFNLIARELLWMISGSTDTRKLSQQGVKIWDANTTRNFLDTQHFYERRVGDLGPSYGFQWRHAGAKYIDHETDYKGQGVDQLENLIENIRKDPFSRRHVLSAWNAHYVQEMTLPPCHILAQFYVGAENDLNCLLFQRSGDIGLGVPFNIASYSLLTCMIAHLTNLTPNTFIHTIGDAHIYLNHVDSLKEQITRALRPLPQLNIQNRQQQSISDFIIDDFCISSYDPHPIVKMTMAV